MSILGINALVQLALPQGWDAAELARIALGESDITYESAVNDIAAALNVMGASMINDPLYGTLYTVTTEANVEYRTGGTGGMNERTEYVMPDPRRAVGSGGVLPIKSWDRGLGWTYDFLRRARQSNIDKDVSAALDDVLDNWQRQLLRRFFSNTENQIGTGYDVPFADGSAIIEYTPPTSNGVVFAKTHNHFERLAAGSQAAALEAATNHLWEHGHAGPYIAIIPSADSATYTGLAKFIRPDRGVQYVQTGTNAPLGTAIVPEQFIGMVETEKGLAALWANTRLPANYLGVYKSHGVNDPRNALAVRTDQSQGAGPVLMAGVTMRKFPLEQAAIWHDFGVGVNDRTAGYAAYFAASGSYVAPTIG